MAKHEMPEPESQRKFREALERKNEKSASGTAHQDAGAGHNKAHGPVENRRNFRRKSG
ncbi:hypothetical protein MINS_38070 [Mycolicibacterium insubricum]|uniref:DUF5302 domain-containing protein n=1 Tax=Mycolicibacterium insubricum TaxID=444597 RepID=UPI00138C2640|nr:DUF5302 domain-containing protein [Mycolicibacterium insubricum]MCB0928771.1 DUF5302 domain-containing protein [Mycobacterium sp.]MCV7081612.1 DUF5302 domain-containing protein [Mycolicibacterium insubricum]BBZ68378.1 hypothetical protein MINS_38070 [Mycolicibacterium insubricum]